MRGMDVAYGTTPGTTHRSAHKNNHDAVAVLTDDKWLVAVVADGCGSGKHSEVGAKLGANWMANTLAREVGWGYPVNLNAKRDWMRTMVSNTATHMTPVVRGKAKTDGFRTTIDDFFLFTLVGCYITDQVARFFAFGDGLVVVNDFAMRLESEDNRPQYIAYDTLGYHDSQGWALDLELPRSELRSFLLGSDGLFDLVANKDKPLPGNTQQSVRPMVDLWTDDRFFANQDAINRYLFLANREVVALDRERQVLRRSTGLLPDDTTLVVGRRSDA